MTTTKGEWKLDETQSAQDLASEIKYWHHDEAAVFFSTHQSPVGIETIDSFVGYCLESERGDSLRDWQSMPHLWQKIDYAAGTLFLDAKFATGGVDDEEYREISVDEKTKLIRNFFSLVNPEPSQIEIFCTSKYVSDEKYFHTVFNLGPVVKSEGLVAISKNRIALFRLGSLREWGYKNVIR